MMKRFLCINLTLLFLCGCSRDIVTTNFEEKTIPITDENTTEEPTTNAEVITGENLLQAAMLNEVYITDIQYPENKVLFKDLYWEWTEFSVVDMDFDGQHDVILYSDMNLDHVRILYQVDDVVMVGGCSGTDFFEDGYGGGEWDGGFVRRTAMAPKQEEQIVLGKSTYSSNAYYEHKGKSITEEEFDLLMLEYNFSSTPVIKYDLTEENIRKYVK